MQDPVKTEQQKDQQSERDIQDRLGKLPLVSAEIAKVIIGQEQIVEELLISVLAGGHCLLEGVPGLAKTLMVST